jgi:hypothetical protein
MKTDRRNTRSSWIAIAALIVIVVLSSVLLITHLRSRLKSPAATSSTSSVNQPGKQNPLLRSFNGCPAEGDGGDPDLNRLKNRVDEGKYLELAFDEMEKLEWPKTIERRKRVDWSAVDTATVSQFEGNPVSVEGYVASARQEGPESPNCHGADGTLKDFHIWLTKNAGEDRSQSIVVEMTPALRAQHPQWTTRLLGRIAREKNLVRVSGWLLLDPEHPDQVGKTRVTIWEIHPIMRFEVEQNGAWIALDQLAD